MKTIMLISCRQIFQFLVDKYCCFVKWTERLSWLIHQWGNVYSRVSPCFTVCWKSKTCLQEHFPQLDVENIPIKYTTSIIEKRQSGTGYGMAMIIVFQMIVQLVNYSTRILWMLEIRLLPDNRELLPKIIWIITAVKENY